MPAYCIRQVLFYAPIVFSALPDAIPRTPNVTFPISGQQFIVTWDEPPLNMGGTVDTYFVNISGPDNQCGNVSALQSVTERNYTCSGPTATKIYNFTVQAANCGGDRRGPESGSIAVSLRGMLKGFFQMKKFRDNVHRI